MKKKMSLKARLILTFLFMGLAPMLVLTVVTYSMASKEMESSARDETQLIAKTRMVQLQNYFETLRLSLLDKSRSHFVRDALIDLDAAFQKYSRADLPADQVQTLEQQYKDDLQKFYSEQFGKTYSEKNKGANFDVSKVIDKLGHRTLAAQYDFISQNPNPLGSKHQMNIPQRRSPYAPVHQKYHPSMRSYLELYGLYDIFLVNPQGDVVYTVFKETDFGTNLASGPWADSGLARAWKASKDGPEEQVYFEDYERYSPSYEAPAAFIGTPLVFEGRRLGTLLAQVPLDRITQIAQSREGLGEKGELLIFGHDGRLRVDSFRNPKTHTMANSFLNPESLKWSPTYQMAREGKSGNWDGVSYDGLPVLSYFGSTEVMGAKWFYSTELSQSEIYEGLNNLTMWILVLIGSALVGTVVVSAWTGNWMAKALQLIVDALDRSSQGVSRNATSGASAANELSESVTEQASSLQETMASLEEISAMVNQNAESSQKARTTVDENNEAAVSGTRAVDDMIRVIGEIKDANEQILDQMSQSNREFSEIVRIISEIGNKTQVINEIVFQTKLLSFNASVEAARAGEHGKGFAVVAEEVGNLAQMSGSAANEISSMLAESIKRVNEIVQRTSEKVDRLVETGRDKISMGEETSQRCQQMLQKISEASQAAKMMVSEISHASTEQAQGVAEINRAITQMDQVTQRNSSVAQQSSSLSEQLRSESESLLRALNDLQFFIHGQHSDLSSGPSVIDGKFPHSADPKNKKTTVRAA